MRYVPHTPEDIASMLRAIGATSVEDLFRHIPAAARPRQSIAIDALDELSLIEHIGDLASRNLAAYGQGGSWPVLAFLGAGLTPHHIPAAVDAQLMRSEWYTCYTPYQPEVSQGTLQAIFEFQTMLAELFGAPLRDGEAPGFLANASLYDGASAAAEAVLMARRVTGRDAVILCGAIHPQYVETIRTYLTARWDGAASYVACVPFDASGRVDLAALARSIDETGDTVACVLLQSPNYLGVVEDIAGVRASVPSTALLVVACSEPLAFGVLEAPGALGADVICGEGIGLATPPFFGGPGVGLFVARREYLRHFPGRLVGETVDQAGERGYVLTLSTREQHIRRERATSNICSNHGLVALALTIHLSLLGRTGFVMLARLNVARAQYARRTLLALRGFSELVNGPIFNEFAVRVRGGHASRVADALLDQGIFCGVPLDRSGFAVEHPFSHDALLIAVSELHRKTHIDRLAAALDAACP